jgi:hypothetical protein
MGGRKELARRCYVRSRMFGGQKLLPKFEVTRQSARREVRRIGQHQNPSTSVAFFMPLCLASQFQTNMPAPVRSTVDRLDQPSAYFQGRVNMSALPFDPRQLLTMDGYLQNKKRKFDRDSHDDAPQPQEPDDKLKDAATLYVGNLYDWTLRPRLAILMVLQLVLYDGGADPRAFFQVR